MPEMQHPALFQTLGMLVGLYGLLYLEVARNPERGWPISMVGLAGKILGPIGFVWLVLTAGWPATAAVLVLTNDLVWWAPFTLYLHDSWPLYREDLRHTLPAA